MNTIKLNLGCGQQHKDGYINVDRYGTPDVCHDIECTPWPWPDNSVSEILCDHLLEHIGHDPAVFIAVIKEMYRVCCDGAFVIINVPHPRHNDFLNDPTHVRPITPEIMKLFSQKENLRTQAEGRSNTPLGLYHGIDFDFVKGVTLLAEPWQTQFKEQRISMRDLDEALGKFNNVAMMYHIVIKAVKNK